jgi:hypothetical protein
VLLLVFSGVPSDLLHHFLKRQTQMSAWGWYPYSYMFYLLNNKTFPTPPFILILSGAL